VSAARQQSKRAPVAYQVCGIGNGFESRGVARGDGGVDAAQVMNDCRLSRGGIDDGVGEVHRAGIRRPDFKSAPVELGDGVNAAKHRAENQPYFLLTPHLLRPAALVQSQLRRRSYQPRSSIKRSQISFAQVLPRIEI